MKKKLLALTMAVTCAATLFGCGTKNDDTKSSSNEACTLTVWGPQEDQVDGGWLPTMCDEFKKQNPNVTIKFGVCSEGDAKDKVKADPEAAADVYMCANDNITELISSNAISKIGGDAASSVDNDNDEIVANSVKVDGSTYGVPFTTNTWFMIYDKTAFTEEEADNFDKMLAKDKVAFPLSNTWYIASFYLGNGCKMFEDGKQASAGFDFSGEKASKVTEYLCDVANNKNFVNDDQGVGIAGLRDGSIKAMFSGSWDCAEAKKALGDKFAVKQLPKFTIDGQEKQMLSFAGSKLIAVNSKSKSPEMANKLAQFLGSKDAQQKHYEMRQIIPSNKELLATDALVNDPVAKAQNDTMLNTSFGQPFIKEMGDYWQPMEALAKSIVNKELSKDAASAETEKLNETLNKNIKK